MMTLRTMPIPQNRAPDKLIRAREQRAGDAYPCIVCGLPVPYPRFMVHVIKGGGVALHAADENAYQPDGGDLGLYPIGPECRKRYPELRPYIHARAPR